MRGSFGLCCNGAGGRYTYGLAMFTGLLPLFTVREEMSRKPRKSNTAQRWFCKQCGEVTTHNCEKPPSANLSGKTLFAVGGSLDHFRLCEKCNGLTETLEISMDDAMAIRAKLTELDKLKTRKESDRQQFEKRTKERDDLRACLTSVKIQCAKALGETR